MLIIDNRVRPANPLHPSDGFVIKNIQWGHAGYPLPFWDDGDGKLWGVWGMLGNYSTLQGIVRAASWEKAWECAVDEIFPDAEPDEVPADGELPEGLHWRGSGTPANGDRFTNLRTGVCEVDPDVEPLSPLSLAALKEFQVTITWETWVNSWRKGNGERYYRSTVAYGK